MAQSQVEKIENALERAGERVITKLSLDITANLVAAPTEGGTPIKTSWASSNWVPNIGSSIRSVAGGPRGPGRDAKGKYKSKGAARTPAEVAAARGSQQAATAALLGYKLGMGTVFISNNVPYVGKLNRGSSPQAKAGFIERAINKALTQDIRSVGRLDR